MRGSMPLASAWPWPRWVEVIQSVAREMGADADRRRLLADIEMQEARRLALAAGDLGDAFEAAEQHHALVEGEHLRPVERGLGRLVPEAMD